MKAKTFEAFVRNMGKGLKKNSPVILAILAGVGVVGTAILASKAGVEAEKRCDEKKAEKGSDLTAREIIHEAAPAYAATAIVAAVTIGCIAGSSALSHKQQASLIGAYAVLQNRFNAYQNAVKEKFGEETHEEICTTVEYEVANGNIPYAVGLISDTYLHLDGVKEQPVLFHDTMSGRFFQSTFGRVLQAEYYLNRNFALAGECTQNEFYDFLGIEPVDGGEQIGWMVGDDFYWIDFDHRKRTLEDGTVYYSIEVCLEPCPEAYWENL